ncbi:MAG TPA: patatin-like phospholipase family protein, partial [Acetobacteraceae bacterium]|nr:patatin-like phospholipase family protein [Acetobacteraceae bacterium]
MPDTATPSAADTVSQNRSERQVVLVLQGGGALGSYQAGAFAALAAGGQSPDWVAGVSIGAINGAIIAGNAAVHRVDRLLAFWDTVTAPTALWPDPAVPAWRTAARQASAAAAV